MLVMCLVTLLTLQRRTSPFITGFPMNFPMVPTATEHVVVNMQVGLIIARNIK